MLLYAVISTLLTVSMPAAAADELDKLRATISLPRVSAKVQFQIVNSSQETPAEQLLKRLNGTDDDIDVYLAAGAAYDAASAPSTRSDRAKSAYRKAEELLKSALQAHPMDAYTLSRYGTARWYGEFAPTAIEDLKKAVELAPGDWRCAANLADCLQSSSLRKLLQAGNGSGIITADPQGIETRIKELKASNGLVAGVDALKKESAEAAAIMDNAVNLSPKNPAVYARRFSFRLLSHACTENILHAAAGEPQDYASILNQPALEDKWKQAELEDSNPRSWGSALKYELMLHTAELAAEKHSTDEEALASIPDASRQHVKSALAKLKEFAARPEKQMAGLALTELSAAFVLMNNYPAAAVSSLNAFHLDPHNFSAIQALNASYLSMRKPEDLVPLLREEIAADDTPLRRLYLIKCLAITGKSAEKDAELVSAVQKFPDDFLLQLAGLDEAMRNKNMTRAAETLEKCKSLYEKLSEQEKADNRANYDIARGIYLALIGKTEIGRSALQHVLDYDPDNVDAAVSIHALPL